MKLYFHSSILEQISKPKTQSDNDYIAAPSSGSLYMQIQQKNIREGNSYFQKFNTSVSQSNVDTMGILELIGKRVLYAICQG